MDGGDVCGAAGLADDLNGQVIDAINAGRIPPAFQEDLQARTNELVNTVNCPPPAPTPKPDEKKKGKKKQEDQQDATSEDELVPLPTVTDGEG